MVKIGADGIPLRIKVLGFFEIYGIRSTRITHTYSNGKIMGPVFCLAVDLGIDG